MKCKRCGEERFRIKNELPLYELQVYCDMCGKEFIIDYDFVQECMIYKEPEPKQRHINNMKSSLSPIA